MSTTFSLVPPSAFLQSPRPRRAGLTRRSRILVMHRPIPVVHRRTSSLSLRTLVLIASLVPNGTPGDPDPIIDGYHRFGPGVDCIHPCAFWCKGSGVAFCIFSVNDASEHPTAGAPHQRANRSGVYLAVCGNRDNLATWSWSRNSQLLTALTIPLTCREIVVHPSVVAVSKINENVIEGWLVVWLQSMLLRLRASRTLGTGNQNHASAVFALALKVLSQGISHAREPRHIRSIAARHSRASRRTASTDVDDHRIRMRLPEIPGCVTASDRARPVARRGKRPPTSVVGALGSVSPIIHMSALPSIPSRSELH